MSKGFFYPIDFGDKEKKIVEKNYSKIIELDRLMRDGSISESKNAQNELLKMFETRFYSDLFEPVEYAKEIATKKRSAREEERRKSLKDAGNRETQLLIPEDIINAYKPIDEDGNLYVMSKAPGESDTAFISRQKAAFSNMGLPWNTEAKRLVSSVMQEAGIKGARAKVVSDYEKSLGGFVGSFVIPRTKEGVVKDILEGGDGEIKKGELALDIGENLAQTAAPFSRLFKGVKYSKAIPRTIGNAAFAPVASEIADALYYDEKTNKDRANPSLFDIIKAAGLNTAADYKAITRGRQAMREAGIPITGYSRNPLGQKELKRMTKENAIKNKEEAAMKLKKIQELPDFISDAQTLKNPNKIRKAIQEKGYSIDELESSFPSVQAFDDWLNGRVVFENIEDIDNLTIPLLKKARADYQKASSEAAEVIMKSAEKRGNGAFSYFKPKKPARFSRVKNDFVKEKDYEKGKEIVENLLEAKKKNPFDQKSNNYFISELKREGFNNKEIAEMMLDKGYQPSITEYTKGVFNQVIKEREKLKNAKPVKPKAIKKEKSFEALSENPETYRVLGTGKKVSAAEKAKYEQSLPKKMPSQFKEDITSPESRQNIFDLVRGYAIREASPFVSGSLTRDIEPFFMDDVEEERQDKKKLDEKKSLEKKQLFKKLYGR